MDEVIAAMKEAEKLLYRASVGLDVAPSIMGMAQVRLQRALESLGEGAWVKEWNEFRAASKRCGSDLNPTRLKRELEKVRGE